MRVAVLIRAAAMDTGSKEHVGLDPEQVKAAGIKSSSLHDGLVTLERAGLITTRRHRGRSPLVTIIETGEKTCEHSQVRAVG